MQKLAEIAFAESKKKGIPMRDYNSVFAIIHPDVRDRNGKLEREGGFFCCSVLSKWLWGNSS